MSKCESCEHKDWRIRELLTDIENLRVQNEGHLRKEAALRAELTRRAESSPQAKTVNDVLEHWRDTTAQRREDAGRTREAAARRRALISPETERYKRVKKWLNGFSPDYLKRAIDRSVHSPWHQGQNKDGKILDDIKHLFANESMIEELGQLEPETHPRVDSEDTGSGQGKGRRVPPSTVAPSPDPHGFLTRIGVILQGPGAEKSEHCWNPEHDDRHRSMSLNQDTVVFNCHACSLKGGPYDAALLKGFSPAEAMELVERYGLKTNGSKPIPTKRRRPLISESKVKAWADALSNDWHALTYLKRERGWSARALRNLDIGLDGDRLIFPVRDQRMALMGILRYSPTGKRPKLLADKGSERGLFPPPEIYRGEDPIWLVEGEPDAIAGRTLGMRVVAIPGVEGWREEWVPRFKDRVVHICFDCDEQGRAATKRVLDSLNATAGVWTYDLDEQRNDGYDLGDALLDGTAKEKLGL